MFAGDGVETRRNPIQFNCVPRAVRNENRFNQAIDIGSLGRETMDWTVIRIQILTDLPLVRFKSMDTVKSTARLPL